MTNILTIMTRILNNSQKQTLQEVIGFNLSQDAGYPD
jgi:hypothetical protein